MSTLNASSASSSSNVKASRFSTLRVFGKFGGSSGRGKGAGDDGLKPPPLPPKDPYYLMSNRSLASLSPESIPGTPMTPPSAAISSSSNQAGTNQNLLQIQYARPQVTGQMHPGSSSLSLASSFTSAVDTPSDGITSPPVQQNQMDGEQGQGRKQPQRKKSSFFPKIRRGTKSPSIRSASGDESMLSPECSTEDENISLPWNFQHNIHVDEGYNGMPPSWTISLAEAGFTEDEIAAIYARKQAGTLVASAAAPYGNPSLQYLHNDRPRSPAAMSSISLTSSMAPSTTTGSAVPKTSLSTSSSSASINNINGPAPVLTHPTPRSTSLPRQYSDASLRSNPSSSIPSLPTPLNPLIGKKFISTPGLLNNFQTRNRKNSSSSSSVALSISVDGGDGRMRPNVVAEQGDGPVEPLHRRDTSAGSGGMTLTGGHRSNGSLTQNQKSSPLSTRPPISLNGSPVNSSSNTPSRPSTPPRRTYHVVNTQPPPPPYTGNGDVGPNGYPLEKKGTSDATPTTARQGRTQRRTSTSLEGERSTLMYNPYSPGPSSSDLGNQNSKRNSRRRSKRIFPSSVSGSVSSIPPSVNPAHVRPMSSSSSSQHSPSASSSSSPKLNRSGTVSSSHSGESQRSGRDRTLMRNDSGNGARLEKKMSLPQVDLKLDGLGFGSLGLNLDLGLDDWTESVIKEATPTTPEFSENKQNKPPENGFSGSSLPRVQEGKYSPTSYGSNAPSLGTLGASSTRLPPPARSVPHAADNASTFSTSPSPSSFSLQFSPVITVESGEIPSLRVQSLSDPLASPTSPFPRSPSPGTGLSDRMSAPLATPSSGGLSPSPHTGLFEEIKDMLAPGALTGGASSNKGRGRQKKSVRRDKDKSPIRRIRGDDYDEDEDDEEWQEEGDRYSAPALSETHSPTLPISPQAHQQQQKVSNRVSAYRLQDREKMQQAVGKDGQAPAAEADGRTPSEELSQPLEDMVEEEVGDDGLLTADGGRHSSNRNSSRSSTSTVSTVTVTHLTATTTIVKRAVATKIGVPGSGRTADGTTSLNASGSTAASPVPSRSATPSPEVEPASGTLHSSRSPSPAPSRPSSRLHSRLHALPPPLPPPTVPPSPPPVGLLSSPPAADLAAPAAVNCGMRSKSPVSSLKHPASPQSSHFGGSEEDSASASTSTGGSVNGSISLSVTSGASSATSTSTSPTVEVQEDEPELVYYLESPLPGQTKFSTDRKISNLHEHHHLLTSTSDTFGGVYKEDVRTPSDEAEEEDDDNVIVASPNASPSEPVSGASGVFRSPTLGNGSPVPVPVQASTRPTIVISSSPVKPGPITAALASVTPSTPAQRYRGWLSEVVKPLEEFIDEPIDPREYYLDLQEIAEGESGSVFAARISETADLNKLKLLPLVKAQDVDNQTTGETALVAIKSVAILPSGSTKLDELQKELVLLKGLMHVNVLGMNALYVDLVEDSLWIRMELMERSLADVVGLHEEGLILQERVIARFTSDILEALQYLRANNIAHRDVRSDNLLLNNTGVLKLADFSNAVKVSKSSPIVSDPVGVLYWQAPEVRKGPYNAFKVDVWSVGATVWEMAQAEPPFANSSQPEDRWPPLNKPEIYSPAFHEFLRLCSEPPSTRPDPKELSKNSFVHNSCGRPVIVQLLQQCMAIEKLIQQREDSEEADS